MTDKSDDAEFDAQAAAVKATQQTTQSWLEKHAPAQGADARPVATFEQLTLIAMGWLLEASCNQADPRLAKIQAALQDYVEAQVDATRDAAPSDAQDAERWRWMLKTWGKIEGWNVEAIDRQIEIDRAASAPRQKILPIALQFLASLDSAIDVAIRALANGPVVPKEEK
jgi:hypothetical protein